MKTKEQAEAFALRFRMLMSYHNLTLRDIAAHTAHAVSTVGTWKNGRIPSSPETIAKVAVLFQVSPEYLLEGRVEQSEQIVPDVLETVAHLANEVETEGEVSKRQADLQGYSFTTGDSIGPDQAEECWPNRTGRETTASAGRTAKRAKIERYLSRYLDRAEEIPDGLAHAWVQLQREFPLDLVDKLEQK